MLRQVSSTAKEYQALLASIIQISGQYLIDHAPELVGRAPLTTNFDVILHVKQPSFGEIPTIEVRQSYIVHEAVDAIVSYQPPNAAGDDVTDSAPAPGKRLLEGGNKNGKSA